MKTTATSCDAGLFPWAEDPGALCQDLGNPRELIEALPLAACVLDGYGQVIATNRAWVDLAHEGVLAPSTPAGILFLQAADGLSGAGQGYRRFLAGVRGVLQGAAPECAVEYACACRTGERWILGQARRIGGEGDVRILVSGTDVTPLRQALAATAAANATLEAHDRQRDAERSAAKQDLDVFLRSAHHDLRSPLRSIAGYGRLLLDDHAADLAPVARDYLEWICRSAMRMGELLEGMLALARPDGEALVDEPLDMAQIAAEVWSDIARREPQRTVRIEFGQVHGVVGDPRLVRQLLQNLFENAWKYTARTQEPSVAFGAAGVSGGHATFCVRDNGAGFDQALASNLFRPFQRLHSAADFPGSGIGLATVRRIVERHGGRAWAQGTPGRGAAFFFTLPAG